MYLPDSPAHSRFDWRSMVRHAALLGMLMVASAAPALASSGRFERLRDQDLRVARVAYRLSIANAGACGRLLAPQLGFVLHSIEQYGPADRDDAARSFGLGRQVGVIAVVPGSPAARAGLAAGDQLASVNGRQLASGTVGIVPTRASVDRAQGILVEEMRRGAVTLRVSGAGGDRDVRFQAETGCPSNVELIPGEEVNAWADGSRILVSEGMLRRCADDSDLALVIGHEMAHNLLHHRERLAAQGIAASGLLPNDGDGSAEIRGTEEEADRLAVGLAIAAAYDLSSAASFLAELLDGAAPAAATHPDPGRRLALLRLAIAEAGRGHGPGVAFSE